MQSRPTRLLSCAAYLVLFVSTTSVVFATSPQITISARTYSDAVTQGLPLVIRVTIQNTGFGVAQIRFDHRSSLEMIQRYSSLVLKQESRTYKLTYVGGPQPNIPLQPPDMPLKPGDSIVLEPVVSLVAQSPPPRQWAGNPMDLWNFLPPGNYVGHLEFDLASGEPVTSNEFPLAIRQPEGTDRPAHDSIRFRHAGFFEGRDPASDASFFAGGRTPQGVDLSRYKELQDILDSHPESIYAEWIRFWKLYHHGPWDQALTYAREHREFPLADNLMFWVAQKYFGQREYDHSREVVTELLRDFPDSDTRARTISLQEKLSKKP